MGITPFDNQLFPQGGSLTALGGKSMLKTLDLWCNSSPISSHLVISPEGSGKSTLIREYFTREKCCDLARDCHTLIKVCTFTSQQFHSDADVFLTLIEAVKESLNNLDSQTAAPIRREMEALCGKPDYANVNTDQRQGRLLLEDLTEYLHEIGYSVCLVVDDFQQLTNHANCAPETFNAMASLAQKWNGLISYIVFSDSPLQSAAENYIISSYFRIFPGPVSMPRITRLRNRNNLKALIRQMLDDWQADEEACIEFTEEELDEILDITAGIPGLVQRALKALYEYRENGNPDPLPPGKLQELALNGCRSRFNSWMRHLDQPYWDTLQLLVNGVVEEKEILRTLPRGQDRLSELKDGALICRDMETQKWQIICPLFVEFLRQELERPQDTAALPEDGANRPENHQTVQFIFRAPVKLDYIAPGGSKTEYNTVAVPAQEFLQRLGLYQPGGMQALGPEQKLNRYQQLNVQLHQALLNAPEPLPPREISDGGEEESARDLTMDMAAAAAGQKVLPDVEPESLRGPVMDSLESRFIRIRADMGLEEELSDELLNLLSPTCQFYVRASLLVENQMNDVMPLLNDYSTHLVMYGKCLEQSLRDGMFPLLHQHGSLQRYNFYTHRESTQEDDHHTFGGMTDAKEAMLGNFYHVIKDRKNVLSQLCCSHSVSVPGPGVHYLSQGSWQTFWNQFATDLNASTLIRNRIHADNNSPTAADVERLREKAFGRDGILVRSHAGKMLFDKLWPAG